MKKLILLLVLVGLVLPNLAVAQTAEEIETQKRLNQVDAQRSTSSATASADKKGSQISFVEGVVTSVTNPVIIISTASGSKLIYTNDSTRFINFDPKGKKLIGFGDIKIGEAILVVGTPAESAAATSKLIIRDQNPKPKYFSLIGKISEIKDPNLTLNSLTRTDLPTTKSSTTTTTLIKRSGKPVSLTDLKAQDKTVTTGTIDDKGNLIISEILIF